MRRVRQAGLAVWAGLPALVGGVLVFASLPPVGFWPLAPVGLALWLGRLRGAPTGRRFLYGWLFGLGLLVPGWRWMLEFSGPGYPVAVVLEALYYAGAAAVVPPYRGRVPAFVAAVAGAGVARSLYPFGGVPMAGIELGQAGAPLGGAARLGGVVAVLAVTAMAGAVLCLAVEALADRRADRRRSQPADRGAGPAPVAVACLVAVAAVTGAAAWLAPDGGASVRRLKVAAVQGGGVRGLRAVDSDPGRVFDAQLAASALVSPGTPLVVWP
ncbi:MAG TPA: hypothetical protein VFH45_01440, partial [Acidimicrobiales bacterium]|nr:hypothetical protein [Acidimicrobiales bacterium]